MIYLVNCISVVLESSLFLLFNFSIHRSFTHSCTHSIRKNIISRITKIQVLLYAAKYSRMRAFQLFSRITGWIPITNHAIKGQFYPSIRRSIKHELTNHINHEKRKDLVRPCSLVYSESLSQHAVCNCISSPPSADPLSPMSKEIKRRP